MSLNAKSFRYSSRSYFDYLSEAYVILIRSFMSLRKSKRRLRSKSENDIRDDLVRKAMTYEKKRLFEWDTESRDLVKNNRIDISIITLTSLKHGFSKRLTIECKKVGVDEYINRNGIMSYVQGKYASELPLAGMIGFLTFSPIEAVEQINKKLKSHRKIQTITFLTYWQVLASFRHSFQSLHERKNKLPKINIFHLMFRF